VSPFWPNRGERPQVFSLGLYRLGGLERFGERRGGVGQGGELGRSLQQLAPLIKADAGVEGAFAEIDGWDHHGNENP
jgi:hypothetical protein